MLPMAKYLIIFALCIFSRFTDVFSQDNYSIKKLLLNTDKYGEIGGYFFDTLLIFSTNASYGGIMNFSYNMFKTSQNKDMTWNNPELFSFDLTTKQHNAPIFLNNKKNKIFITVSDANIEDFNNLKIENMSSALYIRTFDDNRWSYTATGFAYNKKDYFVGHACLNEEEDILFFAANYDNSLGGTDIYMSYLINGVWSEPQNLGQIINTQGNEMYPFVRGNKLYFSSDKHNSKGKQDVFYSEKKNGEWTKPVPVGAPVNSPYNDFAFFVDENHERGFFTSDRDGSFDIYSIISNYQEFSDCKKMPNAGKCVTLYESRTSNLDTNIFQFEWLLGDGNIKYGEKIDYCYNDYGTYDVSLNVIDKLTGKKINNVANAVVDITLPEGIYFDVEYSDKIHNEISFKNIIVNIKGVENCNLYWDFGDGTKSTTKEPEHIFEIPGEYNVRLGIVSDNGVLKELEKYCVYKNVTVKK